MIIGTKMWMCRKVANFCFNTKWLKPANYQQLLTEFVLWTSNRRDLYVYWRSIGSTISNVICTMCLWRVFLLRLLMPLTHLHYGCLPRVLMFIRARWNKLIANETPVSIFQCSCRIRIFNFEQQLRWCWRIGMSCLFYIAHWPGIAVQSKHRNDAMTVQCV